MQFTYSCREFIPAPEGPQHIDIGQFVIVEADNGEDLGVVTGVLSMQQLVQRRLQARSVADEEDADLGRILRIASDDERAQLPAKLHDEQEIVQVRLKNEKHCKSMSTLTCSLFSQLCIQLAQYTFGLPMQVVTAEYQFDRHRLNIYYSSLTRVDFRELIKSLFSVYQTRIWMKKTNQGRPFVPEQFAAMSMATGERFYP